MRLKASPALKGLNKLNNIDLDVHSSFVLSDYFDVKKHTIFFLALQSSFLINKAVPR